MSEYCVNCSCDDWNSNMPLLERPYWDLKYDYNGKIFAYCPWCGEKLRKVKE